MKLIFIDPYGRSGAHPALNSVIANDLEFWGRSGALKNGIGSANRTLMVWLGCIVCFTKVLIVPKALNIVVLAWPNKMLWLLNFLFFIKGGSILGLFLHNNIDRAALRNQHYKVKFPLYILDSGLVESALEFFDTPDLRVYEHPVSSFHCGTSVSHHSTATVLVYSFGTIDEIYSRSIVELLDAKGYRVICRGNVGLKLEKMPQYASYAEYRNSLRCLDLVLVLPSLRWRLSASGFLTDVLAEGVDIMLPNDFMLNFDAAPAHMLRKISRYQSADEVKETIDCFTSHENASVD